VIVTAHVTYIGDPSQKKPEQGKPDSRDILAYPQSIGQKLSPEIPQLFNNIVGYSYSGVGPQAKRKIFTRYVDNGVQLKNVRPSTLPEKLDLESGLADIFKHLGAL
jgi:hypothetical protein